MSVPTTYTEQTFAQYLHSILSKTALELEWSAGDGSDVGNYGEIINDTLIACGVTTIAEMSGIDAVQKLRIVGRYYAWQAAVEALVVEHNLAADGASLQRETVFKQAKMMLDMAADKVGDYGIGPYGDSYSIEILSVSRHDPYQPVDVV